MTSTKAQTQLPLAAKRLEGEMLVHSGSVWTAEGAGYYRAPDSQRASPLAGLS